MTLFTIGHASRPIDEFVSLLRQNGVTSLVDVRRYAGSRMSPQFNAASLAESLDAAGITYRHDPDLGGRRSVLPDSKNTAWRNSGFRGYADWMASPSFTRALDRLVMEATEQRMAVMCAETVPSQCHRNLLADACMLRGLEVQHITGSGPTRAHAVHEAARADPDGRITYPGKPGRSDLI